MDDISEITDDELPSLETEEGREAWMEILLQQDDETLAMNDMSWSKTIVVSDGDNMVIRFVHGDGTEEVMYLKVQKSMAVISQPEGERN